jgi:hypothetical protein
MAEHLLCDEGLRVLIDGAGDRTLLVVKNGTSMRFWTETAYLEEALSEGSIQLSAFGGYCRIDISDGCARMEFKVDGAPRKSCSFPVQDLADALATIRKSSAESFMESVGTTSEEQA